MELRHLRYFCAVAKNESFTVAAKQLHVSQSGVSGQINDLESEIGVKLLRRNRREVSLTREGELFFVEAQQILARSEHAIDLAVRASRGQVGKLTIGLCGPATAPFLPRLIRTFRQRLPGVVLALKDFDPARQPEALVSGEIDIGFTRSVPGEFRKALSSEVLFREPILAALPPGHALARQEEGIQLAQLASESFILYPRDCAPSLFDEIVALCKRARFSPRVVGSPSEWQSVLTLVEAGEGVSIIPACVRQLRSNGVVFKKLLDAGCESDVVVAWRQEQDTLRDGFLDLLRKNRPEMERLMQRG